MSPSNDTPAKQLAAFIHKFTPEIASLARQFLRRCARAIPPRSNSSTTSSTLSPSASAPPNALPSHLFHRTLPPWIHSSSCRPKDFPTRKRNCKAAETSRSTSGLSPQPHWTSPQSANSCRRHSTERRYPSIPATSIASSSNRSQPDNAPAALRSNQHLQKVKAVGLGPYRNEPTRPSKARP